MDGKRVGSSEKLCEWWELCACALGMSLMRGSKGESSISSSRIRVLRGILKGAVAVGLGLGLCISWVGGLGSSGITQGASSLMRIFGARDTRIVQSFEKGTPARF